MSETTGNHIRKLGLVAAAAGLLALSGCASTGNADLSGLQAQIDAVSADAAAAKTTAATALKTANEAKAISEDTETRIDRMFKKAMHK
jgi:murein lipoprotein